MAGNGKAKTHKGLHKRVKITASGKIKRRRAGAGHLLSSKGGKRRRNLRQSKIVPAHMAKMIRAQLTN